MAHSLSSLLASVAVILTVAYYKARQDEKRRQYPPGPPADPLLGHLRIIPPSGQDVFFYELGKIYGDVLRLRVFGRSVIVLNSVQAAVELLDKRGANYSDRPDFPIYDIMGLDDSPIFTKYGDDFRLHRKWFRQYFNKEQCRKHHPIQIREARLLAQNLLVSPERRGDLSIRFSTAIIIEIAYGHRIVSDDDPYVKLAEDACYRTAHSGPPGGTPVDIFPFLRYFPSWFPGTYYATYARDTQQTVRSLNEYPFSQVCDRMAKGEETPSFLESQLRTLQQTSSDNAETIGKLKAAATVLYIAGAETTSSTLTFFVLAMTLHPECQTRAQAEIDSVVGRERLPEFDDRERLPYTECLLQETLRWHHAAPSGVPHRSVDDDIYNGMFIPKGSIIISNTRGMTWDEALYKDARSFDPTRFLPRPMGREEPFPIGPFGFGRRICPGQYLALDSLWIAIVTLLATLHISKEVGDDRQEITPDPTPIASGITSHPRPFQCRFTARKEREQALKLSQFTT